jgi:hypothetical protein
MHAHWAPLTSASEESGAPERYGHSLTAFNNDELCLVCFGGTTGEGVTAQVQFAPALASNTDLRLPRHSVICAPHVHCLSDAFRARGTCQSDVGTCAELRHSVVQVNTVWSWTCSKGWHAVVTSGPSPPPRAWHGAASCGTSLYVFGGNRCCPTELCT